MKKILTILLCLAFGFLLVSCSPDEETGSDGEQPLTQEDGEEQFAQNEAVGEAPAVDDWGGEWILYEEVTVPISLQGPEETLSYEAENYFFVEGENTLLRCNKVTGEISSVCPDPLCEHDVQECDFYRSGGGGIGEHFSVKGNRLYYRRQIYVPSMGTYDEFWKYDIKAGRAEKVFTAYGKILSIEASETGCYFTDTVFEYDENQNQSKTTVLYFADLQGNVTKLATVKGYFRVDCLMEDQIRWDNNGGSFYLSDPDGKNMELVRDTRDLRPVFGNYEFHLRPNGVANGVMYMFLVQKDLTTGEEIDLLDSMKSWTVCGDRIYYLEYLDEPIQIGVNASIRSRVAYHYDHLGGRLYSMKFDGSDRRLEMEAPGVYFDVLPGYSDEQLAGGRYLGIRLITYEETAQGLILKTGRSLLSFDTQTGTYKVGVYEP